MRHLTGPCGPVVGTSDGPKLNFCSNDYLGLATHPAISRALADGAAVWGSGAGASRLVSGNLSPHGRLERAVSEWMDVEQSVLFVSGYQANVGALSALAGEGDAIFSDQLVHASLIDGARLSRAEVHVFRHGDLAHLDQLLCANTEYGIRLIVSDAVFSMDGDMADLEGLTGLARRHGAHLYLDEAHSLGVMGPGGRGLAAEQSLAADVSVRIGTFSKAFGVSGAFVALPESAERLVVSRARSLLYTTAPPPCLAEAVLTSLELVAQGDDLRTRLRENVARFREGAEASGLPVPESVTPIQPVMTGSAERTVRISQALWEEGVFVQGIRPPTVPKGRSRLRVTLTARHEPDQIAALIAALSRTLERIKE